MSVLTIRFVFVAALMLLFAPLRVQASVIATFAPGGEGTRGSINGRVVPGSTVTVTFPDGTSTSVTAPAGTFDIPVAKGMPNGTATVKSSDGETDNATIALLHPPDTSTFASYTVLANSVAGLGENSFALTGNFTAIDNFADYNSASPTFGEVAGFIPASMFHLLGTGSAGSLDIGFSGSLPFSVNLLPLWAVNNWPGTTVPISNSAISGVAKFNSMNIPFTGSVTGDVTFQEGGVEDVTFLFNLSSTAGPITGMVNAVGIESIQTPEPSTFGAALLGFVLCFVFGVRKWKNCILT